MIKINTTQIKYKLLFFVLFFLMPLGEISVIFQYTDEIIELVLYLYIFLHLRFIIRNKRTLLVAWSILSALGWLSTIIWHFQSLFPTLVDGILTTNKFIVGYLAAYIFILRTRKTVSKSIYSLAKFITWLLFLLAIHDLIFPPFFEKSEYRYFLNSIKLMFPQPTYLAAAGVTLLIYFGYFNEDIKSIKYMVMTSFVTLVTLRSKAIGFVIVYWILYLWFFVFKAKHYIFTTILGGFAAWFIGADQIREYYATVRFSPRQILLTDGIKLALKYFPLGTGFGTFGSRTAADHYSKLYRELGYTYLDGMGPGNNTYLSDIFWPTIFAQLGVFGTLIFIFAIYFFMKQAIGTIRVNRSAGFAMLMIMVNMLINSVAETAFFNPTAFLLFIMYGVFEGETKILTGNNSKSNNILLH